MPTEQRAVRRIDDPDVLKGLAQPIRQKLWRLLLQHGPCTVGTLAAQLNADPGQVSYHLRELAKRGWIVHAPELARDRRESWWRAVEESTSWSPEELSSPEGRAVARHLSEQIVRENIQRLRAFWRNEQRWSSQWRAAAGVTQSFLFLTPNEAQQLGTELNEVLTRWSRAGDRARDRGDTAGRSPYLHFMYGIPEPDIQPGDSR